MDRINKLLARAGVASRRGVDDLIGEGRVTVNGRVVRELGTRVDPDRDAIKVDGKRVHLDAPVPLYLMLHKPREVVTTMSDPEGRRTVADLLHGVRGRVVPVGRLDYHSEGLLLLTNDGDWAQALTHPRTHVDKVYRVKVRGQPAPRTLERLARGIRLDGRKTAPAEFVLDRPGNNAWLSVTLREGRKNQIRRMLESVRHPVQRLRRIAVGGVELGNLPVGRLRRLTEPEIKHLKHVLERAPKRRN